MSSDHSSRYPLASFSLLPILFFFIAVSLSSADPLSPSPSFGYQKFDKVSNFGSEIALYGDAELNQSGSFIQVTKPQNFSSGKMVFRVPIKLLGGNPKSKASFSTYFAFSLSSQNGDGLTFSLSSQQRFDIELNTRENTVKINVGSLNSVKTANVSNLKLALYGQERLQCWIDYQAGSNRVEVRLSKWREKMPVHPLISCTIDLSEMFKAEETFVDLSSSNTVSSQICSLYSWSFKLRRAPHWMHSQPLDPEDFSKDAEPLVIVMHKRKDCVFRLVMALVFGTACGALGAALVLFMWTVFAPKRPVAPEEFGVHPADLYECEKVKVFVVEKSAKDDDAGGK